MQEIPGKSSKTREPIRILDVFSGAGGMSLGWMNAAREGDVRLIAAVDSDPYLKELYAWNFPSTNFVKHAFGDPFESNESHSIAEKGQLSPGEVDVLLAGPPCQTFSAAGKRIPHADNRLVFHVCDLADFLAPKIVVIENVPEFSRAEDGRLLGRVRVRLTAAGYSTNVLTLRAENFGVPQTRMRCFTLAIRNDYNWPDRDEVLQQLVGRTFSHGRLYRDGGNVCRLDTSLDSDPTTVSEAIDDLPALQAGEGEQEAKLTGDANSAYQHLLRDSESRLFNHVAVGHKPDLVAAIAKLGPGETPQQVPNHPLRRKDYYSSAYARLDPGRPAPTMTTQTDNPGSGRFTHYRDNRVVTVREVARLQSFPDSFRFFGYQTVQRRHIGNAVPPLLARAVATTLLPVIEP